MLQTNSSFGLLDPQVDVVQAPPPSLPPGLCLQKCIFVWRRGKVGLGRRLSHWDSKPQGWDCQLSGFIETLWESVGPQLSAIMIFFFHHKEPANND